MRIHAQLTGAMELVLHLRADKAEPGAGCRSAIPGKEQTERCGALGPHLGVPQRRAVDHAGHIERLEQDTPRLRHLTLDYCDFDDACAELIATRHTFAGLTRLVISHAANGPAAPKVSTLRKMLCSANLRNLLILEMWNVRVGDAPEALADRSVLPNLTKCVFYEGFYSTGKRLEELRAGARD